MSMFFESIFKMLNSKPQVILRTYVIWIKVHWARLFKAYNIEEVGVWSLGFKITFSKMVLTCHIREFNNGNITERYWNQVLQRFISTCFLVKRKSEKKRTSSLETKL